MTTAISLWSLSAIVGRVAGELRAVDVDRDRRWRACSRSRSSSWSSRTFHSMKSWPSVLSFVRGRLRVQDAGDVVRVQRRDARLVARHDDAAVRRQPVDRERVHARIGDVDPETRGHEDVLAVDEDVEVRVHVVLRAARRSRARARRPARAPSDRPARDTAPDRFADGLGAMIWPGTDADAATSTSCRTRPTTERERRRRRVRTRERSCDAFITCCRRRRARSPSRLRTRRRSPRRAAVRSRARAGCRSACRRRSAPCW